MGDKAYSPTLLINKHVVFHGLSIDHPPSVVMPDDTPFATAFHAAAPKGHRIMKGKTHEKFENISQTSRENWLHHTVAVRHSDSYFDCDISGAWLHVIGVKHRALVWVLDA